MGSDQEKRSFEFALLMERAKQSKLKPADVARLLRVSDARMSQLVGGAAPTERMLAEFREKINAVEHPSLPQSATSPDELHSQLSDLAKHDPAGYEAAKATIGAFHSKLIKPNFRRHSAPSSSPELPDTEGDRHAAAAERILLEGIEQTKVGRK